MSTIDSLDKLFPAHRSPSRSAEWDALKQRIAVGQTVTGTVVAKSPFGAWIDLGIGFPGLLEILVIEGLTPERYRADDWCAPGSEVTAYVGVFRDEMRQVILWQVLPGQWRGQESAQ
jgi:ribosomal protein S1